jgi:proteasome lid subunit RPN8/RPN11
MSSDIYSGNIYRVGGPVRLVTSTQDPERAATAVGVDFHPHARARFEIRLEGESAGQIRDELARVAPYGVESGGYLWAHSPGNRLYSSLVCHASPPAHNSIHEPYRVWLGHASDVEAAWPEWLQRSGLIRVGDYHLHPSGDPQPSEPDRKAWASVLASSGRSRYVGVIATPSVDGSGPQLHGWITRTDGAPGRYVCEPAKVLD